MFKCRNCGHNEVQHITGYCWSPMPNTAVKCTCRMFQYATIGDRIYTTCSGEVEVLSNIFWEPSDCDWYYEVVDRKGKVHNVVQGQINRGVQAGSATQHPMAPAAPVRPPVPG